MIEKLFDLKKMQTDQKMMEKGQLIAKINQIDDEIMLTDNKIRTTSVQKHGAISDFSVLEIHKKTMKLHIAKLEAQKVILRSQLETIVKEIIDLQKEMEQYGYMLEEQMQEKLRKLLTMEEEASSEFIQSKYING